MVSTSAILQKLFELGSGTACYDPKSFGPESLLHSIMDVPVSKHGLLVCWSF